MNKQDLVTELRRVGQDMIDMGAKMDYFSGFDSEVADKGRELLGAGMIAQQWAWEIEKCDQ